MLIFANNAGIMLCLNSPLNMLECLSEFYVRFNEMADSLGSSKVNVIEVCKMRGPEALNRNILSIAHGHGAYL